MLAIKGLIQFFSIFVTQVFRHSVNIQKTDPESGSEMIQDHIKPFITMLLYVVYQLMFDCCLCMTTHN